MALEVFFDALESIADTLYAGSESLDKVDIIYKKTI
jgi:hypothetical protein